MISPKSSSLSSYNSLSKGINDDLFALFNLRIFEYNLNIRKFSAKNKSKFSLNKIKNMYYNKDNNKYPLLTIEHCSKEKNKSLDSKRFPFKNKNQLSVLKKPLINNQKTNYNTYLNLALVPLKNKRKKNKNNKGKYLSNEESKIDLNNIKLDSLQKQNYDKNISDEFIAINKENNPEDDYSDCKSLKGIILSIKRKIMENRYKLNKTFNEFDKQILQDQYLLERFYEMQKCFPNRSKTKYYKNKLMNKQKLFNMNKIKNNNFKFSLYNNKKY